MRAARCPCGVLASFKRRCKRCGRRLHLAHGHPPLDDPDHFERIEHEWFYTGGTHRGPVRGRERRGEQITAGERCPFVHAHPEPVAGHEHGPLEELFMDDPRVGWEQEEYEAERRQA